MFLLFIYFIEQYLSETAPAQYTHVTHLLTYVIFAVAKWLFLP